MTEIPFYWLDIFTESKFKGNPAAVCVLNEELDDETYQNIARELNLSETAFPIKTGPSEYNLRWFTPVAEAPLCGHATIATAYTLVQEYGEKSPLTFHTLSGDHTVEIKGNQVTLNFPKWSMIPKPNPELCKLLGVDENSETFYNTEMQGSIVLLESGKQVAEFIPDFNSLIQYSRENNEAGVIIMSHGDGRFDYVYRVFAPVMGINEDPGTGIVNCMIGHYWGMVLGKRKMMISQPSERYCEFSVEVVEDGVRITGKATPLIKGTLTI